MRPWIVNIALSLVLAALSLCGVELATRAVYGLPLLATTNFVAQMLDIVHANSGAVVYDELADGTESVHLGEGFDTGRLLGTCVAKT